jgi:3-methyladenine DNA glycosylase/8-oxoguanine DNA glycosylase
MKTKKDYTEAFSIIKKAIAKADPYSLLESGSPEDEFDSEVSSIVRQLTRCKTAVDITHAIARTFNSSFSDKFKPEDFIEQGTEIFNKLKENDLLK